MQNATFSLANDFRNFNELGRHLTAIINPEKSSHGKIGQVFQSCEINEDEFRLKPQIAEIRNSKISTKF